MRSTNGYQKTKTKSKTPKKQRKDDHKKKKARKEEEEKQQSGFPTPTFSPNHEFLIFGVGFSPWEINKKKSNEDEEDNQTNRGVTNCT